MINLFVLIIIQQFDLYYLPQDNVLQKFKDNLEFFKTSWRVLSEKQGGLRIKEHQLVKFFKELNEPLGMSQLDEAEIKKEIIKIGIRR